MFKLLLLISVAVASAQNRGSHFPSLWPFGQSSQGYGSGYSNVDEDSRHPSQHQMYQMDDHRQSNYNNDKSSNNYNKKQNEKCPTLRGAKNNDFDKFDGMWFRVQETPNDHQNSVCSIEVYQLTAHNMHKLLMRTPNDNSNNNNGRQSNGYNKNSDNNKYGKNNNNNEDDEIETGINKKIDESSWLTETDDNEQRLVTVLASDHHQGSALIHVCDTKNPRDQQAIILSRHRQLDRKSIDRYHQTLKKNGLDKLESQLNDVQQDNCKQNNH